MTENFTPLPKEKPLAIPTTSFLPRINIFVFVGLGFLITFLVLTPFLIFTQLPKKIPPPVIVSSTPTPSVAFSAASFLLPTNTLNPTQMALTPLPAPTTLLKERYDNPFSSKTQAVNPFGSSSSSSRAVNPFDALAQ